MCPSYTFQAWWTGRMSPVQSNSIQLTVFSFSSPPQDFGNPPSTLSGNYGTNSSLRHSLVESKEGRNDEKNALVRVRAVLSFLIVCKCTHTCTVCTSVCVLVCVCKCTHTCTVFTSAYVHVCVCKCTPTCRIWTSLCLHVCLCKCTHKCTVFTSVYVHVCFCSESKNTTLSVNVYNFFLLSNMFSESSFFLLMNLSCV